MSRAERKRNKRENFKLYEEMGVIPRGERHNYEMHHIVFRSDGGSDERSNLYPLREDVHCKLHQKVERMERCQEKESYEH